MNDQRPRPLALGERVFGVVPLYAVTTFLLPLFFFPDLGRLRGTRPSNGLSTLCLESYYRYVLKSLDK
jgi:hypothetical protein